MTTIKTPYQLGVEVGGQLLGSCEALCAQLEAMDLDPHLDDDLDFCAGLDETALRCEGCDWWCEPSEMSEGDIMSCGDCASGLGSEE